jgi:hypothetical protein
MAHHVTGSARRYDLDALRVGAFLLLILYHLGMFYVPWGWHAKSAHLISGLEPWMGAINPWRLTLLFMISGAATRFMAAGRSTTALASQRSQRLLIPLAFGMLVIIPPQSWVEVVEKNGYTGTFLEFWPRYLSFDQSFGLILPTYNHLWFVAYLWAYTIVALAARPVAGMADRIAARLLSGCGLFIVPVVLFGLYRATAFRVWGETYVIWTDAYAHLHYGTAFLLGLLLARQSEVWERLERDRFAALLTSAVLLTIGFALAERMEDQPDWRGSVFAFIREAYSWTVICALFGYARRYIRSESVLLTTLTEAVFPFYIVHQTTIILVGHYLKPHGLPVLAEAAIILTLTIASGAGAYFLARSAPSLRLPLGLKPQAAVV